MTDRGGDEGQAEVGYEDPWALRNSPYTVEGEIEGAGRFAAGASNAGPRTRRVTQVVVVLTLALMIVPLIIGLVVSILG